MDRNPDNPQNVIDCSLARDTPLVNVSCKSVLYFLSNQTDGLTDRPTNKTGGSNNMIQLLKHTNKSQNTIAKTKINHNGPNTADTVL